MAPSAGADDAQEKRFSQWIEAEGIPFENEEAKAAYQERCTLIKDAVQMKKAPRRIPIWLQPGTFPLEYKKVQWLTAMYDYDAMAEAFIAYAEDFPADCAVAGDEVTPGKVLDLLDVKFVHWAGHGIADHLQYQYLESEFMQAGDYQDLIDDPTGWFLSVYLPRICGGLEPLSGFPNVPITNEVVIVPFFSAAFGPSAMADTFKRLISAGAETEKWLGAMELVALTVMTKGFPLFSGGFTKAPFDVLGDTLRGTQHIMMDLFRRPDLVLEACERLTPLMVKAGVQNCNESGNPLCLIPLHKGADGFMSNAQFRTFYWPTLRKVAIGLMDAGVVPMLFAEGGYNSRLDIISDLPRGKAIWYFDRTDMGKAKETVGRHTCIMGNVPVNILYAGTPDEVHAYCRDLIKVAGPNGGYIFSNGAGYDSAKPENIRAMIDCVRKYGTYA